jgi:alkanesulfonate monooxygenase SsuD/methylene tetrahydromethanopterin reductase-like flavin-dependent oxidoreductase (luciferase family)
VPERNPILTAKQVATLDDACGGRFLFGIGAGWNREESTILGGDFDHRWSQVKDYIAAMKVLWREEISEYQGRYVDFPPVRCFPKPARKPHPPILIGSVSSPHALKRVAEWGDGWLPGVFRRPPRAAKAPRMPDCFIALHPEAAALVRQAQRLARHRPAAGCQAAAVFGVVTLAGEAPPSDNRETGWWRELNSNCRATS